MNEIKGYHCNQCGAFLFKGERHTCDESRLEKIAHIARFLGTRQHEPEEISRAQVDEVLKSLEEK